MAGETNLEKLLRTLKAKRYETIYVFATLEAASPAIDKAAVMRFEEAEGTSYILPRDTAVEAGLSFEFPSVMITLDVHSSLEAVGFIATISAKLAAASIPCNVIAGFYHDHIFVPEERADEVIAIAEALAKG